MGALMMMNNDMELYEWDNYENQLVLEDENHCKSGAENGRPKDIDYE